MNEAKQGHKPSLTERAWNSGGWPSAEGRRLADERLAEMKAKQETNDERMDR